MNGFNGDRTYGLNQMLRDFGMKDEDIFNKTKVLKKIQDIERKFHLIMVMERYFESMILMKDLLCWSDKDMISFKLNAKDVRKKSNVSQESREILKAVLWPDYLLYNHFSKLFDEKVQAFGAEQIKREYDDLKGAIRKVKDECIEAEISNEFVSGKTKLYGKDMIQYQTKPGADPFCTYYIIKENIFIDDLRTIQEKRAKAKMQGVKDHQNDDLDHDHDHWTYW